MRIAFTTLGCKINQYETGIMQRDALSGGTEVVSFDEEADVYVINTCSVTSKADYQCRQIIRATVRKRRGARIIVTGCYAQTRPEEIGNISGVHLVIGNAEKERFFDHIHELVSGDREFVQKAFAGRDGNVLPGLRTRGFLKIQDGCDNRCSYCIVPIARGRSRSVDAAHVLREFERMVHSGCPEVVLSGIHIGTYGADLTLRTDLTTLLKALAGISDGARIRLSSIEPKEITDGLISLLQDGLCRHLHIPLQSGDDRILDAMRRDYTSGFYRDLLWKIAERIPGIALGADVMVGFPGEGTKEFNNTLTVIEESPLTHLHVFSFSPRPGTTAAEMHGQVPEAVKKERNESLRKLAGKKHLEFRNKFLNTETEVIVEDKTDPVNKYFTGLTDNYLRVSLMGTSPDDIGKKRNVRITNISENEIIGIIC